MRTWPSSPRQIARSFEKYLSGLTSPFARSLERATGYHPKGRQYRGYVKVERTCVGTGAVKQFLFFFVSQGFAIHATEIVCVHHNYAVRSTGHDQSPFTIAAFYGKVAKEVISHPSHCNSHENDFPAPSPRCAISQRPKTFMAFSLKISATSSLGEHSACLQKCDQGSIPSENSLRR